MTAETRLPEPFPANNQVREIILSKLLPAPTIILIVEDEPLLRVAATELIEDLGFKFFEAVNADDALRILEDHPEISIVFTDVQMAGTMDGLALASLATKRWPPLRFIIVSGGVTPTREQMPVEAVFLTKPYLGSAISGAIASFEQR